MSCERTGPVMDVEGGGVAKSAMEKSCWKVESDDGVGYELRVDEGIVASRTDEGAGVLSDKAPKRA